MELLDELGKVGVGIIRGVVDGGLLMQGIGGLVELVDGLGAARTRSRDGLILGGVGLLLLMVLGGAGDDAFRFEDGQVIL